jgi:hypothetical protein
MVVLLERKSDSSRQSIRFVCPVLDLDRTESVLSVRRRHFGRNPPGRIVAISSKWLGAALLAVNSRITA